MRNITGKSLAAFEEISPGHWTNGYYSVAAEDIQTEWGRVTHLRIMTLADGDVPWADKQDIKTSWPDGISWRLRSTRPANR
jgi:hypothetical protein